MEAGGWTDREQPRIRISPYATRVKCWEHTNMVRCQQRKPTHLLGQWNRQLHQWWVFSFFTILSLAKLLGNILLQHTKPFQQQTNKNALSNMVLNTEKSVKPTSTHLDHVLRTTNMDTVEAVHACSSSWIRFACTFIYFLLSFNVVFLKLY